MPQTRRTEAESAVRRLAEGVTGFDLSAVTIHYDSARAGGAGVHGLTVGREVHLAPGISPGTPYGDHVLAHELGHVVQQSTGRRGSRHCLEADAELVARSRSTAAAGSLDLLPAPRRLAVQHFDPRYHRTSVVDGLAGSDFSADEIGLIYAANWERDLSQVHPALGNVILEWKAVKLAAHEGHLTETGITAFHRACQAVLSAGKGLLSTTSYGDSAFYEHLDNPAEHAKELAAALDGLNLSRLPDHLFISREYIKEMLFDAAQLNHRDLAGGYTATAALNSRIVRARLGPGQGTVGKGALPSGAVAAETAVQVRRSGGAGSGSRLNPESLALIGRASHALEDFWAHSNFVELAIGQVEYEFDGLTTATVGTADDAHALAHHVRGLADEIAAEISLVDRVAGRRSSNPRPDQVQVGSRRPPEHDSFLGDLVRAAGELPFIVASAPRALVGGWTRGGLSGALARGVVSLGGSWNGVLLLRTVSELLEESTQAIQEKVIGDRQAHGLLAKDQPGHDDDAAGNLKTIRFEFAHALSVAADRMVTARLKEVVNAPDAVTADQRLTKIYLVLDQLISDPDAAHPLHDVITAYRQRAIDAYQATRSQPRKPLGPIPNAFSWCGWGGRRG